LEAILLSHSSISDAAVIGEYSKEEETEFPVAYVVTRQDVQHTDELSKEIKDFVDGQVAPHKKLRGGVVYIDKIPKTASGKILRRELRDRHSN
jgi:4-coumarate--CoA ligase